MTEYQRRVYYQFERWVAGFSEHNNTDNECCPDFSCCNADLFNRDLLSRQDHFDWFLLTLDSSEVGN